MKFETVKEIHSYLTDILIPFSSDCVVFEPREGEQP